MKIERETVYSCDQCGKKSIWTNGWTQWTCMFNPYSPQGFEFDFHTCSDECHNKLSSLTKRQLKKRMYELRNIASV